MVNFMKWMLDATTSKSREWATFGDLAYQVSLETRKPGRKFPHQRTDEKYKCFFIHFKPATNVNFATKEILFKIPVLDVKAHCTNSFKIAAL